MGVLISHIADILNLNTKLVSLVPELGDGHLRRRA